MKILACQKKKNKKKNTLNLLSKWWFVLMSVVSISAEESCQMFWPKSTAHSQSLFASAVCQSRSSCRKV